MRLLIAGIRFGLYALLLALVLVEGVVRAYFAFRVDAGVLLWGTSWYREHVRAEWLRGQNVFEHQNTQAGYAKYFPNQTLSDIDINGEPFAVRINRHGFRGPDFSVQKPQGVFRVLTLGGSSTFGFTNRDDETYPHYLQIFLNQAHAQGACSRFQKFEVINLGVPHLNTEQVGYVYANEGLPLNPDVVTLYSGYNNTLGLGQAGWLKTLSRISLLANFLRVIRDQHVKTTHEMLEHETPRRLTSFLQGVKDIANLSKNKGAVFLPVSQQMRSLTVRFTQGRPVTYEQEIAYLRADLEKFGEIDLLAGKMLIHRELMRSLESFARQHELNFIDGKQVLDKRRDLLATYVHLKPEANRRLAQLMGGRIVALCE